MSFEAYIALGDSMSIDSYPGDDARSRGLSKRADLGAASLLYDNDDELFPDIAGQDLKTLHPGITFANNSVDGATTASLLKEGALDCLGKFSESRALITITVGGNDLLAAIEKCGPSDMRALNREVQEICTRYLRIVKAVKTRAAAAKIILSTVYDPTDGTGIMPSKNFGGLLPLDYLSTLNRFIESCATREKLLLADVYSHFFGHGAECGSRDNFWYYSPSPIEPSFKGASEIRRVWLAVLEKSGDKSGGKFGDKAGQ